MNEIEKIDSLKIILSFSLYLKALEIIRCVFLQSSQIFLIASCEFVEDAI